MIHLAKDHRLLEDPHAANLWLDEGRKIIAFARGGLIFIFDFHNSYSEQQFFVPCHLTGEGRYRVILSTDEFRFGGNGLIAHDYQYQAEQTANRGLGFQIYVPARSAMVLEKI